MTTREAHSTHQWHHQLGECRQCSVGLGTPEAEAPCAKAPVSTQIKSMRRRGKGPKVPNLYAASFEGAKDLVRK